jgi:hypothetical protein
MSARAEPAAAVRTAVVLTHTHPEQTSAALREAVAAAERASCTLAVTPDELEKHGDAAGGIEVREDLPERPDLCLVLGGDGTILSALRRYAGTGVPVFGINFGTIGFLAAVEREELADGLSRAFRGDFDVMDLPGLRAEIADLTAGWPSSPTAWEDRRWATCAAMAWSPPPRPAPPATTSPTRARSWPGASPATWSASSRRTL